MPNYLHMYKISNVSSNTDNFLHFLASCNHKFPEYLILSSFFSTESGMAIKGAAFIIGVIFVSLMMEAEGS